MDFSTLANLINAVAVTAGVLFAAAQINYYRRRRRREAMLDLVRSFQSPTFAKALRRIVELPDGASAETVVELLGQEGEDLLAHLTATWETIGVLLYHKEITLEIVDDFFSGPILVSWRKLQSYIKEMRRRYSRNTWFEWFQWLAERMHERESVTPPEPAYVTHARGTKSYDQWLRRK
jgi:hypothetical protein